MAAMAVLARFSRGKNIESILRREKRSRYGPLVLVNRQICSLACLLVCVPLWGFWAFLICPPLFIPSFPEMVALRTCLFGFKYAPSEEELVQTLEEFVRGNLTREQLSSERSIDAREAISSNQGFHPLSLDWDPQKGMYDYVRYCCRRRPKASGNAKKKTKRETGSGKYWKNLGPVPEVCGGKAKMSKLKLEEDEITWIMHEYTLNDNSKDFQDWAICKIESKSKNNDKEKARRTSKEGTQDSGSGFNMQGQDCDEQIVELLPENSREFGTSEEGAEESDRRNMQLLEDNLNQEINDDSSMINTNAFSSLYKELEQIITKH